MQRCGAKDSSFLSCNLFLQFGVRHGISIIECTMILIVSVSLQFCYHVFMVFCGPAIEVNVWNLVAHYNEHHVTKSPKL
jgi:hypothetical protein